MRSLRDSVLSSRALDPVSASSAQTGIVIDTFGFNTAMFTVQNGAATGSPSSYTVDAKIQECDTSGGSYVDVSGATITQITADSKAATVAVEGLGTSCKRYLKIVVTPALTGGSTPKALVAASVQLGRAFQNPVANV